MATKKRSGEEINDRQILCGMGIKLRRLTAGICLITQLAFPMAAAAQGVVNAATQQPVPAQIAIANANTVPYTLGALESAQSVAERFGISVAELRKLNQFRTFARGFDNVRQGDELDVPAQVSEKKLTPPPGNSSDNLEQQIASTSQQIGSLLAEDMNSEQAANMARGWASSQASGAMTDWLSRFGTARITLGVDEDFSLKNSQFDFLHPWYETPDNLFFSQHTLHRTDERTQINNGLGWRHFTPTWMSGINFFFDHDLSRYHSRAGIGAEYWRDYLKLSSNGYLRLTNWRSAPELDNDYEARPANGWDVRAESWLPAWPHLGGKLVYEQYYGDEVALFDKDDRQSNPHAITAGLNYTPFPLMTFSAEQRQGKQGENDTRFAVDFTWQPGSAMQKQLDPNEVAARRSLAGSRYDLVDRNNNIVLEYRKKELVRLTLTDPVTGKSGEVKSLVSSLQTKYALKGYNVEATALEAAGGKVVTTGKDILVTLPAYRFTSTPETDNTWPIEVTAEDVKGNLSNREQSMVVVQAPTLSQKDSSVSLSTQTLNADSHSTATLTFIAHDAAGNPVVGLKDNYGNGVPQQEVTLSVSPSEGVTPSNNAIYTTNHDGNFYASFTATKAGVYQLTATLENGDSMQQTVTYVPNVANAEITLAASKDPVIADNNDLTTLTATVADTEGNAIANTEVTFTLPEDVKANFTLSDGGKVITDAEGKAKVTLKGTKAGAHTVTASMTGGKSEQLVVNFIADTLTAQVNLNVTEDNFIANNVGMTRLQATVTDGNGNPLANEAVTFTLPADVSASFTLGQGGSAITDINGKAEVTLSGTKSGTYPVTVSVNNYGVSDTKQVTLIADAGTAKLASLTSVYSFVVSTTEGATMTASVTDANGNPVEGIKVNFRGTSVTLSSTSVETDDRGFAEILVTSTEVGLKTVSASLADKPTEVISRLLNASADVNSATITSLEIPEGQVMVAQDVAVKAHVNDQFGNPVAHQPVTFSAEPSSQMIISQNTVSTNTQGVAEVTMTPERNGSYMVKASLPNGASLEKQLEAIDEKLTLTASSPLIGVYAPTGATLTATLTSANGTPVEGQVINFSVTPEGATLSGGKVRTNSSGQAPVVLTSNKVGTYTVTASFHNGVTIQTQTTVKVTGNPSTAHVASFIAEPSTIAATNSDLSTLKATVEDGSGNLIEGLTVYFALKNGSTTLTSLTAVTDQNGIATTSVKGAITGSVTVSTVTSAGGMQTVDITLVAGPADTSQSVLKSNRSSLKGDYTDSAELRLVLHDISGNPIKVSEGMEFVQSGTNVPYIKISAIDYSLNINGDYKATVTGGGEGIATLIPVLNGVHQAGLSTTIQFTRAEDKIMSGTVSVNGTDLPTTTFPSQGFTGAYYQLNNDNFAPGKTAADYEFSSSASWVDVDATGKVTFKNVGSNSERITATPKSGGPSYVYEIRVKSWWVNAGEAFMIYSLAENFCSSNGYTRPRANYLNHCSSRGIGSLYSEWGDMGHYTTDAGFQSNMYWSSSPANSSEQYVVSLATGDQSVFEKLGFAYATCYKNL
nr:inverse autotransporter beta domain-containing protein [Escherichia coli]